MEDTTNTTSSIDLMNRWLYLIFTVSGLIFTMALNDSSNGLIFTAIAMAFDPFSSNGKWSNRKTWQKAWLIIHVTIVFIIAFVNFFN